MTELEHIEELSKRKHSKTWDAIMKSQGSLIVNDTKFIKCSIEAKKYIEQAQKILEEKAIVDIEMSGRMYKNIEHVQYAGEILWEGFTRILSHILDDRGIVIETSLEYILKQAEHCNDKFVTLIKEAYLSIHAMKSGKVLSIMYADSAIDYINQIVSWFESSTSIFKQKETEIVDSKETIKEKMRLAKEATELVIKRSGVSRRKICELAIKKFFIDNIDLLTPQEIIKYKIYK
jgi:hypothetical protein